MTLTVSPERIRSARKNADMTPAQAAQITGIGLRTLAAYELGEITPGGDRLGAMATAYGVDVGFFFIHDPESSTDSTGCGPTRDTAQPASTTVSPIQTGV